MTRRPARAPVLLGLVWLAGVVVATSVGLLAVRLVAAQVGDPAVAPLSAAAAASAGSAARPGDTTGATTGAVTGATAGATPLAGDAPPTPGPTPTSPSAGPGPAAPTPAAVTRAFTSPGGDLGVQCAGTALRLIYTAPAGGFALDERSVGGSEAEVRFEGAGTRVRLRVSCASGQPRLVEQRTDPAGGGDGDDDRGGDDGGGGDDGRDRDGGDRDGGGDRDDGGGGGGGDGDDGGGDGGGRDD